jgi:hypothetical protein
MLEYLMYLDQSLVVLSIFVFAVALLPMLLLAAVALVQFRKYRERQLELGFRNDLLQRGYSIEEIVRVISCRRPTWSESVTGFGDWALQRSSAGLRALERRGAHCLTAARPVLRSAWTSGQQHCVRLCRAALPLSRRLAREASAFCRRAWSDSRPVIAKGLRRIDRGLRRLAAQVQRGWHQPAGERP